MSRTARLAMFGVSIVGFAALLAWGVGDLPPFGHYAGPYGDIIVKLAQPQRHMANAVTAIVFDYRGFDTMGEELLLFAAASALALLLRETREDRVEDVREPVLSDAVRGAGLLASIVTLVVGLYVVAHAFITPGGGFQGGVVLAASLVFLFLAIEYERYAKAAHSSIVEPVEAFGAGAYVALGLIALASGLAFLENFMELGVFGRLSSGGSAILVNWASALAVAGGFLVIFGEILQENMAARREGRKQQP
ncbi:MAG: MnhB domain-containing protein [Gaiellaceae bacterium]